MNDQIIHNLNARLVHDLSGNFEVGLFNGKAGIVVYFYLLYNYTGKNEYRQEADRLLISIMDGGLTAESGLSVGTGLCGVGLSLDFLIHKGYVKADVNMLLSDIDSILFKTLFYDHPDEDRKKYRLHEIIQILYYLYRRIKCQENHEDTEIYCEMTFGLLNLVAEKMDFSFFDEPYSFNSVNYHAPQLLRVLSLYQNTDISMWRDKYLGRTSKILGQVSHQLFSHYPRLNINRLYLYWSVLPLMELSGEWKRYADLVRQNIDIDDILSHELRSRDIFLSNGISFMYWILRSLQTDYPDCGLNFDPQVLYARIENSDAWGAFHNVGFYMAHRDLMTGFPGVVLTMLELEQVLHNI